MARLKPESEQFMDQFIKRLDEARASKAKRSETKTSQKAEIMKILIQSQIKQKEAEHASGLKMKEEEAKLATPKQNTPEQRYLMRRFREENPLAAMGVPEEGQAPITTPKGEETQGISYPSSEVTQDKGGVLQSQPIGKGRQASMLLQKVDQMQAQGKRVHPAILKVANLMRQELGRTQNLKKNKAELSQMQTRLSALNTEIRKAEKEYEAEEYIAGLKEERDILNDRIKGPLGTGEAATVTDETAEDDFRQKWGI